jgi:hypothetical protein
MAAPATNRPVSNIAVAFAAQSASSNIAILRDAGDGAACDHRSMLLTPPNSISPTLPAYKHRPGPPSQVDSDIDLQDAVEHAAAQDLPSSALSREALAGLEAAGQITATMLAKHHLPKIFLGHGSMPVRDIMAHLAQSVPGYSRIPPAKARRLVVAALEHRAGGGLHGEVIFEKVGWGRWHVKGQKPLLGQGMPIGRHGALPSAPTPPASVDSAGGLTIPRSRKNHDTYFGSWAAGSLLSSRDEDMADKMSLDGSETSDSDTSEMDLEHDLDDETDEEDLAAIGPEALRLGSRGHRMVYRDYNYLSRTSGARYRSASAQSGPHHQPQPGRTTTPAFNFSSYSAAPGTAGPFKASPSGILDNSNTSEREAVEALIAMGST